MLTINYRELGSGSPILLLHGFCETNEIWGDFATKLSTHYRLIIPDLPGFGKSALPEKVSMDGIAALMWEWLEKKLSLSSVVIIGHSLGGYVTLAMVAQKANQVEKFGLFHSTANADTEERKVNRDKVIHSVKTNGVEPYIKTYVPGLFFRKDSEDVAFAYDICRQVKPETLIAYAEAMRDRPKRHDILKEFPRPVLIIAGEHDELMPPSSLEELSKIAKKPTFKVITSAGHMGMLENPAKSVEIVQNFMPE
jgi:pimeloyl-ACP methyl ester carboxylesterase